MERGNSLKAILAFLKLCALGLLMGIAWGLISAVFSQLLSFVTNLREENTWLILLLLIGGIATVLLYRALRIKEDYGTNTLIEGLKSSGEIKPIVAPLIFISTVITHLFGGSAGKEGAAIQLGGAAASGFSKLLKLKENERTVFIMCGMSAMFAGMFGTPLTAAFFILEFKANKKIISLAALPCFISAIIAKVISSFSGVTKETAHLKSTPFSFGLIMKVLILAIGIYLLGISMCFILDKSKLWAKKLISNSLIRIAVGAVLIIVLTAIVGDMRYNGSGMNMAIDAIEGKSDWFDFILKLLFTAVTVSVGFKGGEIVPTFCIGATFGCVFGGLLGLDVVLAAALGLVGLFCCATNSLLSAVFLGIELFGFSALPYLIIVCIILWLLPTKKCLFINRFFESPFPIKMKNT